MPSSSPAECVFCVGSCSPSGRCSCDKSCGPIFLKFSGAVETTTPAYLADPGTDTAATGDPNSYPMPKSVVTELQVDLLTDLTGKNATITIDVLKNGAVDPDAPLHIVFGVGGSANTGVLSAKGKISYAKGDKLDVRVTLSGDALIEHQQLSVGLRGRLLA